LATLRRHWPEYLMEATGLGVFMISACVFATVLEHPGSPVRQAVADPLLRRIPMGLAMGATAVAIVYSRWGQRSGAHLNPAVTLTFWRLGKVPGWDAVFYVLAQFAGGIAGVGVAAAGLGPAVAHPAVRYAATAPGPGGRGVAFAAEALMTLILMTVILIVSNRPGLSRFTGLCAAALVATFIIVEAPLSGMSLNPARTVASAVHATRWTALWVYLTAPLLGMLVAAELHVALRGRHAVRCAKLHHDNAQRCIFRCGYGTPAASAASGGVVQAARLEGEHHVDAAHGHGRPADRRPVPCGLRRGRHARPGPRGHLQPRRAGGRRRPQSGDRDSRHRRLEARGPRDRAGRLGSVRGHVRESKPARRRPPGGAADGRGPPSPRSP
jgi:aquaporin Z